MAEHEVTFEFVDPEVIRADAIAEIRRRWGWTLDEFTQHAADPDWYESGGVHLAMVLGLTWND